MNVKIGELVEYVEALKLSHRRRVETLRKENQILVDIKRELEEEVDGKCQVIDNLNQQVKVVEERVTACHKSFKEMEDLWSHRDQNILHWFKINNFGEDRARTLLRFLADTK